MVLLGYPYPLHLHGGRGQLLPCDVGYPFPYLDVPPMLGGNQSASSELNNKKEQRECVRCLVVGRRGGALHSGHDLLDEPPVAAGILAGEELEK